MRVFIKIFFLFIYSIIFSQNIDCVGSSITYNGYPRYTNDLMIVNGYTWRVHDYGVPGAGVVQIPYSNTFKYYEVVQRKSEIVILFLGINDLQWYYDGSQSIRDIWESEYRKLVDAFIINSRVFLGLLIHRVESTPNSVMENATIDKMNIVINYIAQDYGISIIDFKSAIGTNPSNFLAIDGLHPNDKGSELLGIVAYDTLLNENILSLDDEYWIAAEVYKEQKKTGWFSCSMQ